jgi:hypothetical protein
MKRTIPALLSIFFALVVVAAPAQALSPRDAQGCENTKASQLEGYCESD